MSKSRCKCTISSSVFSIVLVSFFLLSMVSLLLSVYQWVIDKFFKRRKQAAGFFPVLSFNFKQLWFDWIIVIHRIFFLSKSHETGTWVRLGECIKKRVVTWAFHRTGSRCLWFSAAMTDKGKRPSHSSWSSAELDGAERSGVAKAIMVDGTQDFAREDRGVSKVYHEGSRFPKREDESITEVAGESVHSLLKSQPIGFIEIIDCEGVKASG